MARLKVIHGTGKYQDDTAYRDVIHYCTNPLKTHSGFIGGRKLDENYAAEEMEMVANIFGKDHGVPLRHSVLSFAPYECITADEVAKIADSLVNSYADEYQVLYAVHEDTDHLHCHMVMNQISYLDGHRYKGIKQDFYAFKSYIQKELSRYHLKLED